MKTVETLSSPFKCLVMTIGELPSTFVESLSYYETLAWLVNYLEKTVIPTVNNNAEAVKEIQVLFTELKNYVDSYFDNLDVQEEINNKLDQMSDSGELAEIISEYIQMKAVLGFDTVEALSIADNVVDGSYARTYGFHSVNDGGGAYYRIREKTNEDVPDGITMIAVGDSLVAILNETMPSAYQFGCFGDGTTDDTDALQSLIEYYEALNQPLKLEGRFGITELALSGCHLSGGTFVELDGENEHNMMTLDNGSSVKDATFITLPLSTAIRVNNTVSGASVKIEGCTFTGDGSEYIAVVRPNTEVLNNTFDNSGYHVTHEVRFSTGSNGSSFKHNLMLDASGFNIQTYNAKNIKISDNEIRNKYTVLTTTPVSSTLTVTVTTPDTETHLVRFGVFVDGLLDTTATVSNNEDGTYTITFANAVTSSNTITFYGWKSLENINVNGGCENIVIENNMFIGSGDSNIVVGNDFVGTLSNPANIQIVGNNLRNAHDTGIICISGTDSCLITDNKIIDCSLACNNANYNVGIIANNLNNSTVTDNVILINETASQAIAGVSCTNYSSNFYNKSRGLYTKLSGNSTNLPIMYLAGLGNESQEGFMFDSPSFMYPSVPDLDTAFVGGRPVDDDYFTYTASGGGVSQDTTNMLVGSGCIKTGSSSSAFMNIRPKLTGMFKKSLVTFRFMAKAAEAGDKCTITTFQKNNSGTVLNGTGHLISPSNTEWVGYEFQVRTASELADDSSTRLRITGDTGHVLIDCISVSYQPID